MMNKRMVIELVKYTSSVAIGVTVAAAAFPAVSKFFGLNTEKKQPEAVSSEDITNDEIDEEERDIVINDK